MVKRLESCCYGENNDKKADYGPIFYEGVIDNVRKFSEKYINRVIYKRESFNHRQLDPLVFLSDFKDMPEFLEFFSPVFNLVIYEEDEQLNDWLLRSDQLEMAMGLCVFGSPTLKEDCKRYYVIAQEATLFDIENGNMPFGGYGKQASFVAYKGAIESRPILISREVENYLSPLLLQNVV